MNFFKRTKVFSYISFALCAPFLVLMILYFPGWGAFQRMDGLDQANMTRWVLLVSCFLFFLFAGIAMRCIAKDAQEDLETMDRCIKYLSDKRDE